MAHGKETPRQKMIGMMYLVLTALLALNVSKDILNAFILVDESLTTTTETLTHQTGSVYAEFDKAYSMNKEKVEKWKKYADQVKKEANELDAYINSLKVRIVQAADGKKSLAVVNNKIETDKIDSKDNTDSPAQVMVGDNNNGEGRVLKSKIEAFRGHLLAMIDKKETNIINSIKKNLNTDAPAAKEGETPSWESEHFEHWPLIAVNTIMSKLQSDVRSAEAEVTRYLYNNIEAGSFKFNNLEATVIPNSNYIIKGNEYSAEVFIAASDTTQYPKVFIGKTKEIKDASGKVVDYEMVGSYETIDAGKNGRAVFKRTGGSIGPVRWGGLVEIKNTDGTIIRRPFEQEYVVAEPTAVISPTKMNVFYLGVDNPVSISVAGVPVDKVSATITNGVIRKSGNSYIVNPANVGNALVAVSAEIDGKKKQMGTMEFKVKQIPPPVPKVAGRTGGVIDRNSLLAQQIVVADLENFDFDASFRVISFTVSANVRSFSQDASSNSNKITDQQKTIMKNVNKGDRVYFQDIKAIGPDGKVRDLQTTLFFKIQ